MTDMIMNFTGDYAWLSNFHRHPVWLPGWSVPFATAEHAYQSCKAVTGEDAHWVRDAPSPQLAKSRGRQVRAYPGWDRRKKAVMLKVLLAKFTDTDLTAQLLSTGDAVLVEGNTCGDTFWGATPHDGTSSGWPADFPGWQRSDGIWIVGQNWLGRELMMVREVLGDG